MSLMKLGLVRGLIGQAVGTLIGLVLVTLLRAAFGANPAWLPEPASVAGAIIGGIRFMYGVGSLDDWIKWMRGIPTPLRHGPPPGQPSWTRYFGVDYNHKIIGIQYGVTGLLMLIVGGSFALIFRTELVRPGLQFLDSNTYNTIMSLHGWTALMSVLLAVGGMSNYLVPLMVGAEDM